MQLAYAKQRVQPRLIMLIADTLIDIVFYHNNPIDAWNMLRRMFNAGDQQQITLLINKLNEMTIKEGSYIDTYLMDIIKSIW